eukprot:TRINITY_DN14744_c0_g1_i1.p1 TRINITY_DN14744_c0_g1~~TRINITY_DN14744_c0_g1_i1.p1  ORF type:complete len:203 (+),score=11.40 TRINITY_DN14744_c0_g1_i1:282-890(+)
MFDWLRWQPDPMLQAILAFSNANEFLQTPLEKILTTSKLSLDSFNPANQRSQKVFADSAKNSTEILTAAAVAGLSLYRSIVVLSACDSGNGKVTDTESLYALSRGFQIPNTKCILAVLWEVEGISVPEALKKSQESIGCYSINIRDWASVISIGSIDGLTSEEVDFLKKCSPSKYHVVSKTNEYMLHEHSHAGAIIGQTLLL